MVSPGSPVMCVRCSCTAPMLVTVRKPPLPPMYWLWMPLHGLRLQPHLKPHVFQSQILAQPKQICVALDGFTFPSVWLPEMIWKWVTVNSACSPASSTKSSGPARDPHVAIHVFETPKAVCFVVLLMTWLVAN